MVGRQGYAGLYIVRANMRRLIKWAVLAAFSAQDEAHTTFCQTIPATSAIITNPRTIKNKRPSFRPANPYPATAPAKPSSTVCPSHHPTNNIGEAVDIEYNPRTSEPHASRPNCVPKTAPSRQVCSFSFDISQINKIAKPRKDKYPAGINAKACSGGSKKVLCSTYRGASTPACKKKSNPIMASQADKVSLI